MPELKHNFLKGRMNKDLDERLVPNGEYRDALNIEVSTSEGSNVGAVQTTMGNIGLSSIPVQYNTRCVGKILDEKNDKLYWLISASGTRPGVLRGGTGEPPKYGDFYVADIIAEYDDSSGAIYPVVVDTFYTAVAITGYNAHFAANAPYFSDWIDVSSNYWTGGMMDYVIYPGMEIDCIDANGIQQFPPGTVVVNIDRAMLKVRLSNPPLNPQNFGPFPSGHGYLLAFKSPNRPLRFQNSGFITGINIIDDFLFWTDNNSEPKKVNIRRGKEERILNPYILPVPADFKTHSMLAITDTTSLTPNTLKIAIGNMPWSQVLHVPLKEEHVTVIRKSPLTTLNLEMRNTPRAGVISGTLDYSNPQIAIVDGATYPNQSITSPVAASAPSIAAGAPTNNFNPFWDYWNTQIRDTTWVNFGGPDSPINQQPLTGGPNSFAASVPIYSIGDILNIETTNVVPSETIRARVIGGPDNMHGSYELTVLSASPNITETDQIFDVTLEQHDPLFEFKFPRFSFRYKYEDGEYSAFAPFSEIAFLPEEFEYLPKKGYNLGMTNNIRKLVIKDFVDDKLLPPDVLSIDILYKESDSPNIYTVKTVTRDDFEWDAISESATAPTGTRGYVNIESEMIHAVLPSNQFLRPWDNVPREAIAQEVTGNRLVYGNYLQNYDMRSRRGVCGGFPALDGDWVACDSAGGAWSEITEPININLQLISDSTDVGWDQFFGEFHSTPEEIDSKSAYRYDPAKSVKTLRTYQLGVVYRDKYGRETPVFSTSTKQSGGDTSKASLYLEKTFADKQNKLKAEIKNRPPAWAESFKFFIKETSNEYYNLAMDRWYDAEDENIWLSFPSSERNKVDIDTFLILKKEKDVNTFVLEPARYKILAIENEAPLFIKTTEHFFGKLSDGDIFGAKTVFRLNPGTSSTGFPVGNASYMYVAAERFGYEDASGASSQGMGWHKSILDKGLGNLYMRMRTASVVSDWYKIRSISLEEGVGGNNDAYYRIDIEEGIFGEDMNITCTDPTNIQTAGIAASLQLEIKQHIIENRAEYEGRFFVKIYKDQLIIDKLIKPTLLAREYTVQDARTVRYINDDVTGRTTYPESGPWSVGFQSLGIDSSINNGWATQKGWDTGSGPGGGTVLAEVKRDANNSGNHRHKFWGETNGWFIDQMSAYKYHSGQWLGGGDCGGQPRIEHGWGGNVVNYVGRGIYNGGFNMTFSFTKITDRSTCSQWNSSPNPRSIFEATQHTSEVIFISKLMTSGTLFRWKEDPDQHIYVTEVADIGPPTNTLDDGTGNWAGNMPFGSHYWNWVGWNHEGKNSMREHYVGYAQRNRFIIQMRRLFDGQPMGASGGLEAQYTPVNDPDFDPWFDSDGVCLAVKGTCTGNSSFDNDEQGCIDAGGTWADSLDSFNTVYSASGSHPGTPAPGIRQDGRGGGGMKHVTTTGFDDGPGLATLQLLEPIVRGQNLENASINPAIWETEPKEDIGLDIYHEVGQVYPIELNNKTNEQFAPIGSVVGCWRPGLGTVLLGGGLTGAGVFWTPPIKVNSWDDNIVILEDDNGALFNNNTNPQFAYEHTRSNDILIFTRPDGSKTTAKLLYSGNTILPQTNPYEYTLDRNIHEGVKTLPWFNCYSFGNGVESDRVRDDYNQVTIDNGPKASTTLDEPYLEERRGSGLIYSGIYNSISGINNLNQFIQAEKITKDLNPTYGSIQKLYSRNTDLVTLCEDKVLKVLANKDALFNADGNANLTATSNVLGQTTPFSGEYGISKNPESFTSESFRAYFADKSRGAVLRLSQDGLTPISEAGMKDWFSDNLKTAPYLIGSYDDRKSTYNLTLDGDASEVSSSFVPYTISFAEKVKGWSSFKSFIPENGESLNNNYYTFKDGNIWRHHDDTVARNNFYNTKYDSTVNVLFNDDPGSVKSYGTLNYEGSQARITENLSDNEYYNNQTIPGGAGLGLPDQFGVRGNLTEFGWYVSNIKTNLQEIEELEFKDKEDKWFSQIKGVTTKLSNIDTREFSVQGIDNSSAMSYPPMPGCTDNTTIDGCGLGCNGALNYDPIATVDDGSCVYCVYGCMDATMFNFDPSATCDDGSCIPCDYGCTDPTMANYDPLATCDDGSCVACINGCTTSGSVNYNPLANCDDGSCIPCTDGCMDDGNHDQTWWDDPLSNSLNVAYSSITGIVNYPGTQYISQAPDNKACNYDLTATCDDGSCTYVFGCTDPAAGNYDPNACINDGSCTYVPPCCPEVNNPNSIGTCSVPGFDDDYLGCDNANGVWTAGNCTNPCNNITIGDYNTEWVNAGSLVWDDLTPYTASIVADGMGNTSPSLLVKHNNVIYIGFPISGGIPIGEEPGGTPSYVIPLMINGISNHMFQLANSYYWIDATIYYSQGQVTRPRCCAYLGCPFASQINFDPYANYPDPANVCINIRYGCTQGPNHFSYLTATTQALNYYAASHIDDGSCLSCIDPLAMNYNSVPNAEDCSGVPGGTSYINCCNYKWLCNQGTNTYDAWYTPGSSYGGLPYLTPGWDTTMTNCYNKNLGSTMDVLNYGTGSNWNSINLMLDYADIMFFGSLTKEQRQYDHYYANVINNTISSTDPLIGCATNGPGTMASGFAMVWGQLRYSYAACSPGCGSWYNTYDLIEHLINVAGFTSVTHNMTMAQIKAAVISDGGHVGGCGAGGCGWTGGSWGTCECTTWDGCDCIQDPTGTYLNQVSCFTPCCS